MRNFRINSIYSRLFMTFLAVMIPIYIIGFLIYNWGIDGFRDEVTNAAQIRVTYLKESLESEVRKINQLQLDCINDRDLNKLINEFSTVPNYELYFMVDSVQQRARIMKNSSSYIGDIIIYLPNMKRMISANNGYDVFDPDAFEQIIKRGVDPDKPLVVIGGNPYEYVVYPYFYTSSVSPLFAIEAQLSTKAISNVLTLFDDQKGSSTMLFDSLGGKLAAGRNNVQGIDNVLSLAQLGIPAGLSGSKSLEFQGINSLVVYSWSDYLHFMVVELIPVEQVFKTPERYKFIFWIFSAVSLLIIIIYSISTYRFIHRPMKRIVKAFDKLKNGDFAIRIQGKINNEFGYLYDSFNGMANQLNELVNRVYKQELYAKSAELKQLQAQINPHFLYNSFFMLHRSIKSREFDDALQLSGYLGGFFQYITRSTSLDEMKLYQEVEHLMNYTAIQCFRFHGRLSVEYGGLEDKYRDILVPRLILQPLMENAIEHGMKTTLEGGIVRLGFGGSDTTLEISIEDNGNGLKDSDIRELQEKLDEKDIDTLCTGIINVHRRIRIKFGPESGLAVYRSELGGLKVVIRLVLAGEVDHVQNSGS